MRKTRMLGVTALVVALVVVGAWPASAASPMRASLVVSGANVTFDPETVVARCGPRVPQGLVESWGSGELTSEAYSGPVRFEDVHCTVLAVQTPAEVAAIRIHAGLLTIITPHGEFSLAFEAPGVFTGVFGVVPWRHTGDGPYTITGGTGIFAGVSGHGHVRVLDDSGHVTVDLNGSLGVPA